MRPPSRIVASVAGTAIIFVAVSGLAAAEVAANAKHCLWRVTNARAPFTCSVRYTLCSGLTTTKLSQLKK
jgi:hypothetical protein